MTEAYFHLDVDDDGSLVVLKLAGELDLSSMARVEEAVDRHCHGRRALVVDMRELEFMDSSGLRLIVNLQSRDDGTAVAFVPPPARVDRLLHMTGVRDILRWVDEPHEVLRPEDAA